MRSVDCYDPHPGCFVLLVFSHCSESCTHPVFLYEGYRFDGCQWEYVPQPPEIQIFEPRPASRHPNTGELTGFSFDVGWMGCNIRAKDDDTASIPIELILDYWEGGASFGDLLIAEEHAKIKPAAREALTLARTLRGAMGTKSKTAVKIIQILETIA